MLILLHSKIFLPVNLSHFRHVAREDYVWQEYQIPCASHHQSEARVISGRVLVQLRCMMIVSQVHLLIPRHLHIVHMTAVQVIALMSWCPPASGSLTHEESQSYYTAPPLPRDNVS